MNKGLVSKGFPLRELKKPARSKLIGFGNIPRQVETLSDILGNKAGLISSWVLEKETNRLETHGRALIDPPFVYQRRINNKSLDHLSLKVVSFKER